MIHKMTFFKLITILFLISPTIIASKSNQSQTPTYLVNVGEKAQFLLAKYSVNGNSSNLVQRMGADNQILNVIFQKGMITTVEVTDIHNFDNGTIIPYGKVSYNNQTLHKMNIFSYVFETVNDINYWNGYERQYSNSKLEGNIFVFEGQNKYENVVDTYIQSFYWKSGWLAYVSSEIKEGNDIIFELELINLDYSGTETTSMNTLLPILSIFIAVFITKNKKRSKKSKDKFPSQ